MGYKKSNHIFFVFSIMSFAMFILFASDSAKAANDDALRQEIQRVDARAAELAKERARLRMEMNSAVLFSKEARKWLVRYQEIEEQISAIEKEDQSTFDKRYRETTLEQLRQEQDTVKNLDGGIIIDGLRYITIDELITDFKARSQSTAALNSAYENVLNAIKTLDIQRDQLVSQLSLDAANRIQVDEKKIEPLKETLQNYQEFIEDDELWTINDFFGSGDVIPIHMATAMHLVTLDYAEYLMRTGQKYQQEELAARIKKVRAYSDEVKRLLKNETIPALEKEITQKSAALDQARKEYHTQELAGCWMIIMQSESHARVNVVDNGDDTYTGYISDPANLEYFRRGHCLFNVRRTTLSSFEGTENTFSATGAPMSGHLYISIYNNGRSLTYRSDDTVEMWRCK